MQLSDKTEDAIVLVLMNGISQIFVSLVLVLVLVLVQRVL